MASVVVRRVETQGLVVEGPFFFPVAGNEPAKQVELRQGSSSGQLAGSVFHQASQLQGTGGETLELGAQTGEVAAVVQIEEPRGALLDQGRQQPQVLAVQTEQVAQRPQ